MKILILVAMLVSAGVSNANQCSADPRPDVLCKSEDGKVSIVVDDTRASFREFYDGLGRWNFCDKTDLRIDDYKMGQSDIYNQNILSADYGVNIKTPDGSVVLANAYFHVNFNDEARKDSGAPSGISFVYLERDQKANMYIFTTKQDGDETFRRVDLSCEGMQQQ